MTKDYELIVRSPSRDFIKKLSGFILEQHNRNSFSSLSFGPVDDSEVSSDDIPALQASEIEIVKRALSRE